MKPFDISKNERVTHMSMISSHYGEDKYENPQKDKLRFLMNTKWNGHTYSLEKFTGIQKSSLFTFQEASDNFNLQITT